MLTALEKFRAPIVGFANEELSQTQEFNCHKLNVFSVGKPIQLEVFDKNGTVFVDIANQVILGNADQRSNVTFFSRLLVDDERISLMDLEYWVDYMYLFGVKDMIPLYDHMDFISYRNWDVYVFLWSLLFFILFIFFKIFQCIRYVVCCRFLNKKAKVD